MAGTWRWEPPYGSSKTLALARWERRGGVPTEAGGRKAPLRVVIAEDQYLTREGTRRLLDDRDEIEVVGVACDLDSVLAEARRWRPDVILMDIKMPPSYSMEGIEAAHLIKGERPETGVVMLTQHDDEGYVWALLEHGVAGYGYLHKVRVGDVDQLVRVIGEVGFAMSEATISRWLRELRLRAGIDHRRLYDCRQTAATLLLAQGVHPGVIMDVLFWGGFEFPVGT